MSVGLVCLGCGLTTVAVHQGITGNNDSIFNGRNIGILVASIVVSYVVIKINNSAISLLSQLCLKGRIQEYYNSFEFKKGKETKPYSLEDVAGVYLHGYSGYTICVILKNGKKAELEVKPKDHHQLMILDDKYNSSRGDQNYSPVGFWKSKSDQIKHILEHSEGFSLQNSTFEWSVDWREVFGFFHELVVGNPSDGNE